MRFRRHFFSCVKRAVRLLSNELNVIFIMRKADGHFRGVCLISAAVYADCALNRQNAV